MATVTPSYTLTAGEPYDAILLNAIFAALTIGAIVGADIAAATITGANIASATIEGANIKADAIGASHIASNTISADHIMSDAVIATKIKAGAVTSDKIYAGAVTADKLTVTELSAISANLGQVTSGIVTAAVVRTSASPSVSRVIMDEAGLRGYDDTLGLTFRIPTDGTAPIFASGVIQSATIIDTTIISNDFKTSSELPWVEMTDSGLAFRFTGAGDVYGTGLYDTATYGAGVAAYFGNSAKPVLCIEEELDYADIRLLNRSSVPSGACLVGDIIAKGADINICRGAGTGAGATWHVVGERPQNDITLVAGKRLIFDGAVI